MNDTEISRVPSHSHLCPCGSLRDRVSMRSPSGIACMACGRNIDCDRCAARFPVDLIGQLVDERGGGA